ncbi:MAG: VOC family protein, partial [Mariprofundus sp.]|nr:VOC family protein [Mariprofundus sp.]
LFCFSNNISAPESSKQIATDLPRIGIKHFGVRVADIQLAKERVESLGLADGVKIVHGRTGIEYFFLADPDGIMVEVVQDNRNLPV